MTTSTELAGGLIGQVDQSEGQDTQGQAEVISPGTVLKNVHNALVDLMGASTKAEKEFNSFLAIKDNVSNKAKIQALRDEALARYEAELDAKIEFRPVLAGMTDRVTSQGGDAVTSDVVSRGYAPVSESQNAQVTKSEATKRCRKAFGR